MKLADQEPEFYVELSKKETMRRWRVLAASSITWTPDDPPKMVERLTVCDVGPVCAAFWRAAYGIPEGTANSLLAAARARTLRLDLDEEFSMVSELAALFRCKCGMIDKHVCGEYHVCVAAVLWVVALKGAVCTLTHLFMGQLLDT